MSSCKELLQGPLAFRRRQLLRGLLSPEGDPFPKLIEQYHCICVDLPKGVPANPDAVFSFKFGTIKSDLLELTYEGRKRDKFIKQLRVWLHMHFELLTNDHIRSWWWSEEEVFQACR